MGSYGLAMVRQSDNSFVLLATQRNLLTLTVLPAEEIRIISVRFCVKAKELRKVSAGYEIRHLSDLSLFSRFCSFNDH